MKIFQYTVDLMATCLFMVFIISCETMKIDEEHLVSKRVEITAAPDVRTKLSELRYTICLFQADFSGKKSVTNANYKLIERKDTLTKDQVDAYYFVVNNAGVEAKKYSYKLFVHATPAIPETKVTDMIIKTSSIEDIEIAAILNEESYIPLSKDNYYSLKEIEPEDIYSGNYVVKLILKRVVGQLVFDFFKCDSVTKLPINIDPTFKSTLDRVECIEIKASGITTKVKPFNQAFTNSEASITSLLIYPKLKDDYSLDASMQDSKIIVPITSKDNVANFNGGVRVFTMYLLPTGGIAGSSILKTNLTFHYYDTTPLYTSTSVTYDKRNISLNIPSVGKELTVIENCYTITNVRLTNNRIIDIDINALGDIIINTDWAEK